MVLPALIVSACISTGPSKQLAAPAPAFLPQTFFAGHTVGDGQLRVALSRSVAVHVEGDGQMQPDGSLILKQRVEEGAGKPRNRVWHLRPLKGGRFTVSLSDAVGPVETDVAGNQLHLRFNAKGGVAFEQWIYLQPGGQSAINRMTVRKFGLPVASLRETIRRVQ